MEFAKGNIRDYLLMFLLIGVSGIPYFASNQNLFIIFSLLLIALFLNSRNQKFDGQLLYFLLAILLCVGFQALVFSYFKLITIIGLVLKILTGYFVVKLLRERFIEYYIKLLTFFSLVSLVIFIPIFIYPPLLGKIIGLTPSFLSYQYELWGYQIDRKTLIIYNLLQEDSGLVRNCGPFWEPGAFGGFLIVGLILNTIRQSGFSNKINGLLILTIISTQSTTAYLALFAFVFLYFLIQDYSFRSKLLVIIFGVAGVIAFYTIPFLGDKIKNQNAEAQDQIEEKGGDTRVASAILDWDDIKRYPLTGRGIWPETRVDKKFEYVIRNNGFTNFLAEWGILIFALYFFLYYKGFKKLCDINNTNRIMPFVIIGVIFIVSASENYFGLPFFWSLLFLNVSLENYPLKHEMKNSSSLIMVPN